MSSDKGRQYHRTCTGDALKTVKQNSRPQDLQFFAACFCPFVQRVWIALEYLGIPYEYYEVDPYAKPQELLEVSPKGLVPALRINAPGGARALNESTIIMEYLEELSSKSRPQNSTNTLLPAWGEDPYARALIKLQSDHVNRNLVPAFYRYLQAQDEEGQLAGCKDYIEALEKLGDLFNKHEQEDAKAVGLWHPQGQLGWTDIMVVPWIFRSTNVLKEYRGFEFPSGDKFQGWVNRLLEDPVVQRTCSAKDLYLDSYERYAFNRPNTSQVANAINSGCGLP